MGNCPHLSNLQHAVFSHSEGHPNPILTYTHFQNHLTIIWEYPEIELVGNQIISIPECLDNSSQNVRIDRVNILHPLNLCWYKKHWYVTILIGKSNIAQHELCRIKLHEKVLVVTAVVITVGLVYAASGVFNWV